MPLFISNKASQNGLIVAIYMFNYISLGWLRIQGTGIVKSLHDIAEERVIGLLAGLHLMSPSAVWIATHAGAPSSVHMHVRTAHWERGCQPCLKPPWHSQPDEICLVVLIFVVLLVFLSQLQMQKPGSR